MSLPFVCNLQASTKKVTPNHKKSLGGTNDSHRRLRIIEASLQMLKLRG